MGVFKWTCFAIVSLHLLFNCNIFATSTQLMSNSTTQGDIFDICQIAFCGNGTCHHSSTEALLFRCDCNSGWKKFNLGFDLASSPCVLPNCTVDSSCSNGSLPAPNPFPTPSEYDPCSLSYCGDGTCVKNSGSDFTCQCNEGSANILKNPKMTCLKKCMLGANCNGIDLGFGTPVAEAPPTTSGSGSPQTGSSEMWNSPRVLRMLTVMMFATIFQNWT